MLPSPIVKACRSRLGCSTVANLRRRFGSRICSWVFHLNPLAPLRGAIASGRCVPGVALRLPPANGFDPFGVARTCSTRSKCNVFSRRQLGHAHEVRQRLEALDPGGVPAISRGLSAAKTPGSGRIKVIAPRRGASTLDVDQPREERRGGRAEAGPCDPPTRRRCGRHKSGLSVPGPVRPQATER